MKHILTILLCLIALTSKAQINCEPATNQLLREHEVVDTIPTWIVFIDSVRMFARAPEYDLRLEVAPGWVVQRKVFSYSEVKQFETYYDTNGIQFNSDIVLFTHRRRLVYNKFRQ